MRSQNGNLGDRAAVRGYKAATESQNRPQANGEATGGHLLGAHVCSKLEAVIKQRGASLTVVRTNT